MRTPALVATPFEAGIDEGIHDGNCLLRADEPRRQCQDVGVVMFPGQAGQLRLPCQCRTHARVLVGGDVDPVATSADEHAERIAVGGDRCGNGMCEVGVVDTVLDMGAFVPHLEPTCTQVFLEMVLEVDAGMVAADEELLGHGSKIPERPKRGYC